MDRVDKVAFALRKRKKPRVFFKLPTAFPQCVESIRSYPHIREKNFFLLQNVLFAMPRGRGKNKGISGEMRAIQASVAAAAVRKAQHPDEAGSVCFVPSGRNSLARKASPSAGFKEEGASSDRTGGSVHHFQ